MFVYICIYQFEKCMHFFLLLHLFLEAIADFFLQWLTIFSTGQLILHTILDAHKVITQVLMVNNFCENVTVYERKMLCCCCCCSVDIGCQLKKNLPRMSVMIVSRTNVFICRCSWWLRSQYQCSFMLVRPGRPKYWLMLHTQKFYPRKRWHHSDKDSLQIHMHSVDNNFSPK